MTDQTVHSKQDIAQARHVHVVDVSPRDGLQNEKHVLSIDTRVRLINDLVSAGVKTIEVGSFVSPKWVPQMAGTDSVLARIADISGVDFPVLVPNLIGLDAASRAGAKTVAIFASATDGFSKANLNAPRDETFARFAAVAKEAVARGLRVRGYISCAVHCPFEGWVEPHIISELASELMDIGCYEVSVCDTTGRSTPDRAGEMTHAVCTTIGATNVAVHYHDTFGMALENTRVSLDLGVSTVDGSVAGLGGCPYSPGAAGNLDTVKLVKMLDDLGMHTGINQEKLSRAATSIRQALNEAA